MLKDIVLLGLGAAFGLGASLMATAAPLYFPNASQIIWHWVFWAGLILMAIMLVDAGILLILGPHVLTLPAMIWGNLGVLMLGFAIISQTGQRPKSMESPKFDLSKNEGVLVPGAEATPVLPNACKDSVPSDAMMLFFGTSVSWFTGNKQTIIQMRGEPMLVVAKDGNGNLTIETLKIFDDQNEIIANVDKDGFWVRNTNRKKRPDPSTLMVYDRKDAEALKIQFLNPRAIIVRGIFRRENVPSVVITDTHVSLGNIRGSHSCFGAAVVNINVD
jgi:hypothetical protein